MQPLSRITPATVDVLQCLVAHDGIWGLQVIKRTARPAGSVYPILERLERAGWVESAWDEDENRPGPRRRIYTLTEDGEVAARRTIASRAPQRASAAQVALP